MEAETSVAEVTVLRLIRAPVTMVVGTREVMSSSETMRSVILSPGTGIKIPQMTRRDTSTNKL